jgi:hypothetical protein
MGDFKSSPLYEILDSSARCIRLIRLRPGVWDSPIVCELQTIDFECNAVPEYEALSYEWGVQDETFPIVLDQRRITIRENLLRALQHVRHPDRVRALWIDALCINQTDIAEKNHQVALMSDIYSKASNVVIWLGLDAEMVDFETIRLMLEFSMWKLDESALPTHQRKELFPFPGSTRNLGANMPFYPAAYHLVQRAFDSWQVVEAFFNQTYWKRLWILQEVLLAKKITIQCQEFSCSWKLWRECSTTSKVLRLGNDYHTTTLQAATPTFAKLITCLIPFRHDFARRRSTEIEVRLVGHRSPFLIWY